MVNLLLELTRFLLRAIVSRPGEARVEHIRVGDLDLLFLSVSEADKKTLSERDREALNLVVERVGKKLGREVIVDWK